MLEVCKKECEEKNYNEIPKSKDIITTKIEEKIGYDKNGNKTIKYEKKYTNLTKKINETAKILKIKSAEEKIAELENLVK